MALTSRPKFVQRLALFEVTQTASIDRSRRELEPDCAVQNGSTSRLLFQVRRPRSNITRPTWAACSSGALPMDALWPPKLAAFQGSTVERFSLSRRSSKGISVTSFRQPAGHGGFARPSADRNGGPCGDRSQQRSQRAGMLPPLPRLQASRFVQISCCLDVKMRVALGATETLARVRCITRCHRLAQACERGRAFCRSRRLRSWLPHGWHRAIALPAGIFWRSTSDIHADTQTKS